MAGIEIQMRDVVLWSIDSVRDHFRLCIARQCMVENLNGTIGENLTRPKDISQEFFLFTVDAQDRVFCSSKRLSQPIDD